MEQSVFELSANKIVELLPDLYLIKGYILEKQQEIIAEIIQHIYKRPPEFIKTKNYIKKYNTFKHTNLQGYRTLPNKIVNEYMDAAVTESKQNPSMKVYLEDERLNRYKRRFLTPQADNELFKSINIKKHDTKKHEQQHEQYKQNIKNKALTKRLQLNDMLNTMQNIYNDTKSADRKHYEEFVTDKRKFQQEMKRMMINVKNQVGFEVDIGDDGEKQLAFTKVLQYLHKTHMDTVKAVVQARELSGRQRWFTVNNNKDVDAMIGHILGDITFETDASDTNPVAMDNFQPDSFKIVFINKEGHGKNTRFTGKTIDLDTDEVVNEEFEIPEEYRSAPEAAFWSYINLTNIDLSCLQIYKTVDQKNYNDCCFVYACMQSGVFTESELNAMRQIVQTRSLPSKKLKKLQKTLNVSSKS